MKKIYSYFLIGAACPCVLFAQAPTDPHNINHALQGPGGNSPQFTNDVVVAPSPMREHNSSITVSFNGWIYEATGLETMDSDSSGGIVRYSKDNGTTWNTFASWLYPGVDYINPEIEVAGTDTNNLNLFVAGAWYDSTSGDADVWVDKYNGRNGQFISEVYSEGLQYPVRDLDIATDYRYPAYNASPYSVGLLYSHFGSADSIIFVSSANAGTTWGNRKGVAGTGSYCDQVSLAFGISSNWSNGRYFAAWEERSSFSATSIGRIKTAHCQSTIDGAWTSPICLDSIDVSCSGVVRRPRISCQYNSTVNNDSNAVSTVVMFERAFGGDTSDCDIIGFCSWTQPASNRWYRFDVVNDGQQTLQPDIAYDPAYNNFLLTYFNRTAQAMPYLVNNFNMQPASAWITITSNYCDQPSTCGNPFPHVTINPAVTQAAFSWVRQAAPNREEAMFDAEYLITSSPFENVAENTLLLYPNPSADQSQLTFTTGQAGPVRIDLFDMNGQLVQNLADESMSEGTHQLTISSRSLAEGTYFISVVSGTEKHTVRFVVVK